MAIKCSLGYYPVSITATKSGKPLAGATFKVESWALIFGSKVGSKTTTRTTDNKGMAHACIGVLRYGKVSIRHPSEDLGSGKGKWYNVGSFSSLRSPKTFAGVVRLPALPPYKPPAPTPPVIPVPVIPTPPDIPTIPIPPIIPTMPTPPEIPAGLPSGRIGAIVRLTLRNYIDDKPTLIGGTYWGARGASDTSAKIAQVTPTKQIIELQRGIDIGETRKFKSGFSVKVIRSRGGYPGAYADVIVTPTPGIIKPPPSREPPISIVPEKTYTRITRILSEGQDLPKANNGEIVRITAESYCKVNGKIDKSKVPSLLIVDGVVADRKPVVDGVVAYEWSATSIPPRHTICVQINPTDTCRSIGRDCKKISVSSRTLDLSEQLLRERTSAKEQRELMRQSRSRLREEIVGAIREAPVYEAPTVPTPTPTPPIATPIKKPPAPQTGNIKLTGLPLSIPKDIPAYIYVDNINKGSVSILPVTLSLIPVGTHSVYVMAGEFKSISKSVDVIANETSTVSLL